MREDDVEPAGEEVPIIKAESVLWPSPSRQSALETDLAVAPYMEPESPSRLARVVHVLRFWQVRDPASSPEVSGKTNLVLASGERGVAVGQNTGVVLTGDNNQVFYTPAKPNLSEVLSEITEKREKFFGDFLMEAQRQAQTTFRMSAVFSSLGGLIVLVAGAFSVQQVIAHGPNYASLVSGLAGAIIGTAGAALALHADRTRKYLAEQARFVHDDIRQDHRIARAMELVDSLRDEDLKDHIRVAIVLERLGSQDALKEASKRVLNSKLVRPGEDQDKNQTD